MSKPIEVGSAGDPLAERAATISLVLPAWNEADVIAEAVAEADRALSRVAGDYEIIVVDDGSTDETSAIVHRLTLKNNRLRLIQHPRNRGYGAAIRSGFAAAEKDLLVFTDADCQFDLSELDRFVLLSKRYDIVCGYRIDRQDTPLRCFYSKVYNLLVQVVLGTGVRDVDCALKMFHRDVAKELRISGNGFLVNSELLVQANRQGRCIVEVGVSHRPRTLGESTVSVRHIPKVLASLARYWWNEVHFSAPNRVEEVQAEDRQHSKVFSIFASKIRLMQWSLLLIAAVFMLTNLGYPLIDRDETRYAEIPREMIVTGNWILPQLNFETYYDKPPLLYWLCAISYKLFGVNETSARLVPAVANLAMLAATMFFGSRIFGRRIGLFAGAVLFLSVGFAFTSRYLLLDGVLSLFVSLSLFTAYEAVRSERVKLSWWIGSGICIGLAFLTKGPIAIVLWLPPVLAMVWLSENIAKPRWWQYGLLGGIASIIAVPWFVMVHQQDPTFLIEFFYKHNVSRFAGEFHSKPIWYFIPVLLVAGHPWSFLTIPYARFLFRRGAHRHRPQAIGFLLLWSAWCFVFFSVSKCKLPTYLLPTAPALALMIGHYLNEIFRDDVHPSERFFARFWSARAATAATCIGGLSFVIFAIFTTDNPSPLLFGWAMLWTLLLVTSLLFIADRYQAKFAWGTSTGVAFLFAVMMMHQIVPAYSRSQTLFGQSSALAEQLTIGEKSPVATIDHEFSEVPFYLDRGDIPNFADVRDSQLGNFVSRSGTALLIVDDHIAPDDVLEQLPTNGKLIEVARRGSARIYRATTLPGSQTFQVGRVATAPDNAFHGIKR